MAKRTRRRRRSWSRLLLLVVFVAAALYAGYFCLFRPPEVPAETTRPDEAEEVSAEDTAQDAEALAQAAHLERKPYFYTILVSGVDDHNGGSDTNILVAVDAENDYIYGVSIPRDTKAVINGKNHKINFAYNSGGTALLAETISQQLGIPVDFTVTVDLDGFAALVNAIGGVDFEVPISMNYDDPYQDLHIHFSAGMQHLSGAEALKVVRTAESESEKEDLLKMLRAKTGISYQSLERDLQNLPEEKQMEIAVPPPSEIGTDKYKKAARFILAAKLFSAPYAGNCDLEGIKFEDDVHKIIAEYIIKCEKNAERVRPSELFEVLDEDCPEFNEILDLNYGDKLSDGIAEKFFSESVQKMELKQVNKKIEELNHLIDAEEDMAKRKQLIREIDNMTRYQQTLK